MTDPRLPGESPRVAPALRDTLREERAPAPRGVLSPADMTLLARTLQVAHKSGSIDVDTLGAISSALRDLATFDYTAIRALAGEVSPEEIDGVFGGFAPWPAKLRSARSAENTAPGVLTLQSPGAPILAAIIAGNAGADGAERGPALAASAITAMLSRMEPVVRVVNAARALDAKAFGIEEFSQVARFAAKVIDSARDPRELVELLSDGPMPLPFPSPVDPDGIFVPPRRPPLGAWLSPENQAWAQCAMGLARRFPPPPTLPKTSPPPGAIEPQSICAGAVKAGGQPITIRGTGFGTQDKWGVAINGAAATISSWTDTEIQLTTTALIPGCNQLKWTYALDWSYDDEGVGDACAQALRLPMNDIRGGLLAMLQTQSRFWTEPGQLSVLGASIASFTASSGTNGTKAEPCEPVTLTWSITDLPCGANRAQVTVRLLRDGVPVLSAAGFTGYFTETTRPYTERDTSYALEVTSVDSTGSPCTPASRPLTVERGPKRLAVSVPSDVIVNRSTMGTVNIPCPASPGGLVVTLAASPATALVIPASVTIAEGMRSAQFAMETGTTCGPVTLTANAAAHLDGTAATCSVLAPKIDTFMPPSGLKSCEPNTITLTASCISSPPTLKAFAIAADGTKTVVGVQVPPGGSCVRSSTVTLRVPALAPGAYQVELQDRGGTALSTTSFTLAANPQVVNAPSSISFNVSTPDCPPATVTLNVDVTGADAVDFVYTSPDGTVMRTATRSGSGAVCARWSARFSEPMDRIGSITVTPKLGTVNGPPRTVAVTMTAASNVFSAIVFRGVDADTPKRSATLTRREEDPMMPGEFVETPAGEAAEQRDTAPIPLKRCRFTTFKVQRAGSLDYETTVVIGHPDAPVSPVIAV